MPKSSQYLDTDVEREDIPEYDPNLFDDEWNAELFDYSSIDIPLGDWDADDTI